MTSMNISLPEPLKLFVEEQVSKGGYSTASEYLRELIREAQRRTDRQELEAKLLAGLNSPTSEMSADEWASAAATHSEPKPRTSVRRLSGRIIRSDLALEDLDALSEHIRQRSPRAALRFLRAAELSFRKLSSMPGIGERFETDNVLYQEIRSLPISGFPSYIVYYKPLGDGVVIIRVIHAARDIDRIFGDENSAEQE